MTRRRVARRVSVAALAPHFIHVRGYKVLKDKKLATLFGLTLGELYRRAGPKLWKFPAGCFVQLPTDAGRSVKSRPSLAFTQSGVVAVASVLRDEAMLEIGMDIAYAMQIRRRSSAYKKRPARRAQDLAKAALYIEAVERMVVVTALHAIMKRILDAVKTQPARKPTLSA